MTAKRQPILAEQGARLQVTLAGAAVDLTGKTCSLQVRPSRSSSTIKITGSTSDGRLTVSGTSVMVDIPASAMNVVVDEDVGYWVYGIEAWTGADDVIRAFEGPFHISRDVNRADGDFADPENTYLLASTVQPLTEQEKANVIESLGLDSFGAGDVVGPTASADGEIAVFDGTTGKALKRGSYTLSTLLAAVRDRATHTGSQLAATISDFAATVASMLTWSAIIGKPSTFEPNAHKANHAVGGSDALTAADIGAASASHTHTIGAWAVSLGSDATGDVYYRSSGGVLTRLGIGSSGQVLTVSGGLPAWATAAGGSPAGSSGEPQYNNGGAFGAMSGVAWDSVNKRIGWGTPTPAAVVHVVSDNATEVALIAQAAASATAAIQEWRSSGGVVLSCVKADGSVLTPDGSQSSPGLQIGDAGYGLFRRNGTLIDVVVGGTMAWEFSGSRSVCFGTLQLNGANSVTGFSQAQTDYTSGGTLDQYTAGSFRIHTNAGATGDIALTWSDQNISTGCENEFVVVSPFYLRVNAPTSHTIRNLTTVSSSAGYIRSNQVGARIRMRKLRSGEIFVLEQHGTWTIDS